ncbi:hypothetical protein O3M35_006976 [Rhynocoris fuscipes]|uniref:Uncharacterized protein n=1 Tax=Rhynocoris fuscipes TaxID=488301 RepID=A0AAW1DFA7_9HEMI
MAAGLVETNIEKPRGPPPLLRSRTLPAIIVPGINILQAQIDSNKYKEGICRFIFIFLFNFLNFSKDIIYIKLHYEEGEEEQDLIYWHYGNG